MHSPVGHFKSFFSPFIFCGEKNKGANPETRFSTYWCIWWFPYKFYQHYQWRKVSLHFTELFSMIWMHKETKKAFDSLFELLKEIHLFNYVHFRFSKDPTIRKAQMCKLFHEILLKEKAYPLLEELLLLKSLETEEITIKRYQFSSASVLHHAIMNSFQLKISNNLPSNLNNLSSSYNHCVHCLGTKLSWITSTKKCKTQLLSFVLQVHVWSVRWIPSSKNFVLLLYMLLHSQ